MSSLAEKSASFSASFWREKTAFLELIAGRLGLIEILPGEQPHWNQIRFAAHQARIALKFGDKGRFFFDPDNLNKNPDPQRVKMFADALRACAAGQKPPLETIFPDVNPVHAFGILRRITLYPGSRKLIQGLDGTEENLRLALGVLEATLKKQAEGNSSLPEALIISHKKVPDLVGLFRELHGSPVESARRRLIDTVYETLQMAIFMAFGPYLGAALIGAELEESGKIGGLTIIDYKELQELQRIADILRGGGYKLGFMTGVLSQDVKKLPEQVKVLKEWGLRPVIGGLAPTIDPYAIALSVEADVFLGEAEGAMDLVLEVIGGAQPGERFIFHRGLPPNYRGNDKYVKQPDAYRNGLIHVYLDLPERVDLKDYYAPEREKAGRLARRIRLEEGMQSPVSFGGRQYDPLPFTPTQMVASVFCPSACIFCSTPRAQGTLPRRMPLESIELRIRAMESKWFVLLDQNWGAIGADESEEEWQKEMLAFFSLVKRLDRRVIFQTDASFLERVAKYPKLQNLVGDVSAGILIGIEHPKRVRGTKFKDPKDLKYRLQVARQMGLMVIGTIITGLPESYLVTSDNGGNTDLTFEDWRRFLKLLDIQILWAFPFFEPPGAVGTPITEPTEVDPLGRYQAGLTKKESVPMVDAINRDYYTLARIFWRLIKMIGYRRGRIAVTAVLNMGYLLLNMAGKSSTDVLKGSR